MAVLDFPDTPTIGQVHDKWTWDGTVWRLTSGSSGGGSGFTFSQDVKPTATRVGDTWFQTDTGNSFVWTNDGNSTQWVQYATAGLTGTTGHYFSAVSTANLPASAITLIPYPSPLANNGITWATTNSKVKFARDATYLINWSVHGTTNTLLLMQMTCSSTLTQFPGYYGTTSFAQINGASSYAGGVTAVRRMAVDDELDFRISNGATAGTAVKVALEVTELPRIW